MKENSLTEHLIRLAYTEIVLHHAEVDPASKFIENLQSDLESNLEPNTEPNKEPTDTPPNEKRSSRIKGWISNNKKATIIAALAFVLITPYIFLLFWVNIQYKSKILPGTSYASIQLDSDPDLALKQIEEASSKYKLSLKFNEQTNTYSPQDIGIDIDSEETLNKAKDQSSQIKFLLKPLEMFKSRTVSSSVKIDQERLKLFLTNQNYSDKLPEDARIEFSQELDKFTVIPEISGRGIDSKSLTQKLELASASLSSEVIDLKIEDVPSSIKAADLTEPTDEANLIISQKITIKTPNKNYSPSASIMKDWIVLTPDPSNSTYKISFNEETQKQYIDSVVAKVNRKMEKKLYATIDGSEMLLQEGSSGLKVNNADLAKSQITGLVKAKNGGNISLEATEEAPATENIAASGGRWIFADISQFRVYAYEGSSLVNSFAMSSGAADTPTPPGNYSVMSKIRVKTMRGGTPGTRDYYSVPNIEWVAYFKSGGYAIHGVYWHNNFGVKNTSHGCMGMSNANAQWVYNFVEVGTPVVIVP